MKRVRNYLLGVVSEGKAAGRFAGFVSATPFSNPE